MPKIEVEVTDAQMAWIDARIGTVYSSRDVAAQTAVVFAMRAELNDRMSRFVAHLVVDCLEPEELGPLCENANDEAVLCEITRLCLLPANRERECMQPSTTPVPPTPSSTGVLEAMDLTGDTKVHWDKNKEAEVIAARASFDALKAKGYKAFRLAADGSTGSQMDSFDASAERILMMPQMAGG
jgi:hypothetical protein